MSAAAIAQLARFAATAQFAYHGANKEIFLRETHRFAQHLAVQLELAQGTFDVRMNRAGIACSGEVILHADHLYVSLGAEIDFGQGRVFMFRGCRSCLDFVGLGNQWARWTEFATDFPRVLAAMRTVMNQGNQLPLRENATALSDVPRFE